ncbi:lipid IV(A) 3-deoxy-D-manno-octulosonic acid transferase [Thiomicrospira microaerophila]|uniref:lipid IV(A) 3-deoxy-D-manno-octulosonic acid transferase n=1 Tax=Thiomicrospira microaerophila TaxID=406020 RepID=UPI0005C8DBBB|nr:lipid IV(A) 3-deoxy-D-manno-octulosonic acid transferase [Thiomicrospira microaerophila]
MSFLYSFLFYFFSPVIGLILLLRSIKDKRYRQRWCERLGVLPQHLRTRAQGAVVIHCASVGEVEAAKPLINALCTTYPLTPILVTCTTPTGSERIHTLFGDHVAHCYLPLDMPDAIERWLSALSPRALILLETELWPNLLIACRKAKVDTFLVNGRLSKKSARAYRRYYWFTRLILNNLDAILVQNQASLRRFKKLGFNNQAWSVGNLKFDFKPPETPFPSTLCDTLKNRTLWVAGSTHPGEDEILIQAFKKLSPSHPTLTLVLVPRHPERFNPVAQQLLQAGCRFQRLSQSTEIAPDTQVILGDTMGDLVRWYQQADTVFIGGSLVARGGHNPLEAISFGKPMMSGRQVFNFADIYRQLDRQHAVAWVHHADEIVAQLNHWLLNPDQAQQTGDRAQAFFNQHHGATLKTLSCLTQYLGDTLSWQTTAQQAHTHTIVDTRYIADDIRDQAFSPDYWRTQNKIIGHSTGRNQVWFIEHNQQKMVLRHYYRGGFIGKGLKDQFFGSSAISSRAFQEFRLLNWMRTQGLPVPRACGARYQASGLFYRADILIELIPHSQDLFTHLCQQPLAIETWQAVGRTIARFHQAGIYHADLNCHNILLDSLSTIWLIDFDKCERRPPGQWQNANLARLERSLHKEQAANPTFYFSTENWRWLRDAYAQEDKHRLKK